MNTDYQKIGVLMGGWSSEREISLRSGLAVAQSLNRSGIDAIELDVTHHNIWSLQDAQIDCAFIVMHGRGGEDGLLQAVLTLLNIPFTGSGVIASALAMDKAVSKQIWQGGDITTPKYALIEDKEQLRDKVQDIGYPLALKPVAEGSSIGVSRVTAERELDPAWHNAVQANGEVMIEQWIEGVEYAVGFVNDEVLPPIRLETMRPFYDYQAKYQDAGTRYHCPCGLMDDEILLLQDLCRSACTALKVTGWGRVDAIRATDGAFYVLEVNTVPGMTDHSLVPIAAQCNGIDFDALVLRILDTAQRGGAQ